MQNDTLLNDEDMDIDRFFLPGGILDPDNSEIIVVDAENHNSMFPVTHSILPRSSPPSSYDSCLLPINMSPPTHLPANPWNSSTSSEMATTIENTDSIALHPSVRSLPADNPTWLSASAASGGGALPIGLSPVSPPPGFVPPPGFESAVRQRTVAPWKMPSSENLRDSHADMPVDDRAEWSAINRTGTQDSWFSTQSNADESGAEDTYTEHTKYMETLSTCDNTRLSLLPSPASSIHLLNIESFSSTEGFLDDPGSTTVQLCDSDTVSLLDCPASECANPQLDLRPTKRLEAATGDDTNDDSDSAELELLNETAETLLPGDLSLRSYGLTSKADDNSVSAVVSDNGSPAPCFVASVKEAPTTPTSIGDDHRPATNAINRRRKELAADLCHGNLATDRVELPPSGAREFLWKSALHACLVGLDCLFCLPARRACLCILCVYSITIAPALRQSMDWIFAVVMFLLKVCFVGVSALGAVVKYAADEAAIVHYFNKYWHPVRRSRQSEGVFPSTTPTFYVGFYMTPVICDWVMNHADFPHFTPHLISVLAMYYMCLPDPRYRGHDNIFKNGRPIGKHQFSQVNPADGDKPELASQLCHWILRSVRLSLPLGFIFEGFSKSNASFMLCSSSVRLSLAFFLSMTKNGMLLSPLAWLGWSIQVLLAWYCPSGYLLDSMLVLVGLAFLRLVNTVQRATESRPSAVEPSSKMD